MMASKMASPANSLEEYFFKKACRDDDDDDDDDDDYDYDDDYDDDDPNHGEAKGH